MGLWDYNNSEKQVAQGREAIAFSLSLLVEAKIFL